MRTDWVAIGVPVERPRRRGIIGGADVLAVTAAVRDVVAAGERPLVLGGCCRALGGRLGACERRH
jgi:hypothetical protein